MSDLSSHLRALSGTQTNTVEPGTRGDGPRACNIGDDSETDEKPSQKSLLRNRWLISISVVVLFVTSCYWLIGLPYFETNDDVAMAAIATGTALLGKPEEHLIFGHAYLGLLLKQLYSMQPAVPWYGIFQAGAVYISMTAITWLVILKSRRPMIMLGLASGTLLLTCLRPLLLMQFTTSGALTACAGALLLMESVERWHLRKRAVACGIGAALMIALSTLIRFNAANLVLIVTTLFVISRFITTPLRQWRKLLAHLLAIAGAFAIVFTSTLANDGFYRGEWSDIYKINRANTSIREFRCDQIDSPLRNLMYQHVGWTSTDATLYMNWYGLDKEIYSVEILTRLSKLMRENQAEMFDIDKAISSARNVLTDRMFPLTFSLLLLLPFISRTKFPIASRFALSFGVLSLCAYFILYLKLPMRVFDSIILTLTLFSIRYISISRVTEIFPSIFATSIGTSNRVRSTVYGILLLAVFAPALWLIPNLNKHLWRAARQEGRFNAALHNLSPKPEQLYVAWGSNPEIITSPFTDLTKTFHNFRIIPVGAIGPAPFVMNRLRDAGVKNLLGQLDRDDIFLISNYQYNRFIRMYAAEKLGKEAVFEPIPIYPKVFECFKVKYVQPADPEKLKRDLSVAFLIDQQPEAQKNSSLSVSRQPGSGQTNSSPPSSTAHQRLTE